MREKSNGKKRIPAILRTLAGLTPQRWIAVRTEGSANIPELGPVVIAARHYHHLYDGIALLQAMPRPIHFVVTLDWVQSAFTGCVMKRLTDLAGWPVVMRDRRAPRTLGTHGGGGMPLGGIRNAVRLLLEGSALVIFPEGYPNVDPHFTPKTTGNEFLPFDPGFARIAALASRRLRAPVPIVPTGLSFRRSPKPRLTVRFGEALFFETPDAVSDLVQRVEEEVKRLSERG